jgi:hypothetical protein
VPRTAHPCPACGKVPCECPEKPCPVCGERPCVCKKKATVKLADGKDRALPARCARRSPPAASRLKNICLWAAEPKASEPHRFR